MEMEQPRSEVEADVRAVCGVCGAWRHTRVQTTALRQPKRWQGVFYPPPLSEYKSYGCSRGYFHAESRPPPGQRARAGESETKREVDSPVESYPAGQRLTLVRPSSGSFSIISLTHAFALSFTMRHMSQPSRCRRGCGMAIGIGFAETLPGILWSEICASTTSPSSSIKLDFPAVELLICFNKALAARLT